MLVSNAGQVIRVPVGGIRIASRATKGVTIFNTAKGEKVVSVERISDTQAEEEEMEALDGEAAAEAGEAPAANADTPDTGADTGADNGAGEDGASGGEGAAE